MKSYFYDDFGNLWGSWGGIANRYLYTGQEYDSDIVGSEFYNLRARYYDPKVGRFTSEDPEIGFIYMPQQRNLYPYVWNMPITLTDPLGLFTGCKVISKYPVRSKKELVSVTEETFYELEQAYTTFDLDVPLPGFWIFCDWLKVTDVCRIYREITIWSYVLKCWEKCEPPYITAYDVIIYGPLLPAKISREYSHITTYVPYLYNIIQYTPANKMWLEEECKAKGRP